jgi:hypothetical protein
MCSSVVNLKLFAGAGGLQNVKPAKAKNANIIPR